MFPLTVFVAIVALSSATRFQDCGSNGGVVKSIKVNPCTEFPCVLHRGTTPSVEIEFDSNKNSNSLTASVHGILSGFPVPFPIPQSNGCEAGVKCPMTAGSSNVYTASIPVLKIYPSLKLLVKWQLTGDDGSDIVCVQFPVEIMD